MQVGIADNKIDIVNDKCILVTADMGYGHQRAIYPLKDNLARNIITMGQNDGSTLRSRRIWKRMLRFYEFLSRSKEIPFIGKRLFSLLDHLLEIPALYPRRNMSAPTFQVRMLKSAIKQGICDGITAMASHRADPLITSFYAPAIAADGRIDQPIYCIICDADLNRAWVAENPEKSKIIYFAPCGRAAKRLKDYGVAASNIKITGFPLPCELLGNRDLDILRADLAQRLFYLDPGKRFRVRHSKSIEYFLGSENLKFRNDRILTLMFAVGGAGAQKEIGKKIALSLQKSITDNQIKLIISAGTRAEVKDYFLEIKELYFPHTENFQILYHADKYEYFAIFNHRLRTTDILWTKPSELSFYCALGIPLILSPAIGSQEQHNRRWITEIQAGYKMKKSKYTHQWLFDMINEGRLAEAAWSGFLKARKYGTFNICDIIETGSMRISDSPVYW